MGGLNGTRAALRPCVPAKNRKRGSDALQMLSSETDSGSTLTGRHVMRDSRQM